MDIWPMRDKNKNLRKLILTENRIRHVEAQTFRDFKLEGNVQSDITL